MNCFRSDLVQPEREKVEGMIERLKSTKGAELVKTCELLAYEVFLPWLNKQNAVNKSYFDECGGIQLLVKLMEHGEGSNDVKRAAGYACWSFGENYDNILMLYRAGALDAIRNFLKSPDADLQLVGCGCIWGLMKFEDVVLEQQLIPTLIDLISLWSSTQPFELFRPLACLQCSSMNKRCREVIVNHPKGLETLFNAARSGKWDLCSYFGLITLANLACDNDYRDRMISMGVLDIINQFIKERSPTQVREMERQKGIIWNLVRPFVTLLDSDIPTVQALGTFIFASLSHLEHNREQIKKEGLLDYMLCVQWHHNPHPQYPEFVQTILHNFSPRDPPSLFNLSTFQLKHNALTDAGKSREANMVIERLRMA